MNDNTHIIVALLPIFHSVIHISFDLKLHKKTLKELWKDDEKQKTLQKYAVQLLFAFVIAGSIFVAKKYFTQLILSVVYVVVSLTLEGSVFNKLNGRHKWMMFINFGLLVCITASSVGILGTAINQENRLNKDVDAAKRRVPIDKGDHQLLSDVGDEESESNWESNWSQDYDEDEGDYDAMRELHIRKVRNKCNDISDCRENQICNNNICVYPVEETK